MQAAKREARDADLKRKSSQLNSGKVGVYLDPVKKTKPSEARASASFSAAGAGRVFKKPKQGSSFGNFSSW